MVISQIFGGLGNQMFQYAVGRALSLAHGESLRLDVSGFYSFAHHQGFELLRLFDLPAEVASLGDVQGQLGWQSREGVRRILGQPRMAMLRSSRFVVEPHFQYWPGINQIPRNCYLSGYWQSEKYFKMYVDVIRSDFKFKEPLSTSNLVLVEEIAQTVAVSLHVRRGDYANNPKTNSAHGLCSLDYYREAIKHVMLRVNRPHFFIFSDDIAWAKKNLKIEFPHQYIAHNQGAESYNDMRLMSICDHHIIANSSFSWWGAWLNPNLEKIVIAPKRWFANETNTQDLIPQSWLRV